MNGKYHKNHKSLSMSKLTNITKLICTRKLGKIVTRKRGRYIQEIQNMHKGEYLGENCKNIKNFMPLVFLVVE